MPTESTRKKQFIYLIIIIISFFILLELTFRLVEIILPPQQVDIGLGFTAESKLYVKDKTHPDLLTTNPEKTVAFHHYKFPLNKDKKTTRIFFIGGSSVHFLESKLPQWEKYLINRLSGRFEGVQVINSGGKSYGSQRLVPIVTELLKYHPDLLLLYSGHNEFEELEQLKLASLKTKNIQKIISKFAFLRFFRDRIVDLRISKIKQNQNHRILENASVNYARAWRHQFTKKEVEERMLAYENNLEHIIHLCRENNVPLIMGTVPSNLLQPYLSKDTWKKYMQVLILIQKKKFTSAEHLARKILRDTPTRHQSSDIENEIIRRLAKKYDIVLADVEKAVNKAEPHSFPGLTLFSDHCHLNDKGNNVLLETFAQKIIHIFYQAAPSSD